MGTAKITPEDLAKSARRYRKELLMQPVHALGPILRYFTLRKGIRGDETVGELSGNIEMGPYDENRTDEEDVSINGRTLHTYFGNVIKKFSPNKVAQSIYGSDVLGGEGLVNVDIVLKVLAFLSAKIGNGFALHLFDAVRKDNGTRTVDLFNGIDTITAADIKAGLISVELGNLYEFTDPIDSTNAYDMLLAFCRSANEMLLGYEDGDDSKTGTQINLICSRKIIYDYRDDYKSVTGHSPIYDKFNQTIVEGFPNIRLVPAIGKVNSDFIQLSTKKNMLIGVDQMSDDGKENMRVEKHHPYKLDFVGEMFFGTNYESVSPEALLVGRLKKKEAQKPPVAEDNPQPEGGDDNQQPEGEEGQ